MNKTINKKPISPIGRCWDDEFESKIFTPEEIAASDLRVARMIEISEDIINEVENG